MTDSFAKRLQRVLGGRKPTPWCRWLGITTGTRTRLLKDEGIPPTHETLARIMRAEGVSLSWLLGGSGPSYLVARTIADSETAELLRTHLEDTAWEMTLLTGGSLRALMLEQDAEVEHSAGVTPYRAVELIAGPIGPKTLHVWESMTQPDMHLSAAEIGPENMQRLYAGELGTWQLVGGKGHRGLARVNVRTYAKPLTDIFGKPTLEDLAVADETVPYIPIPTIAKLQHHWARITDRERQALSTFIDLATAAKDPGKG